MRLLLLVYRYVPRTTRLLPSKSTVGMPLSLHAYVYTSIVVPITTCLSLLASNQAGCSTESFSDKTLLKHSPLGPHGPSNSLLLSKSAIGMPLSLHAYLYTSIVVPITTCLSLLAYRYAPIATRLLLRTYGYIPITIHLLLQLPLGTYPEMAITTHLSLSAYHYAPITKRLSLRAYHYVPISLCVY